jgi:hypothetical protein
MPDTATFSLEDIIKQIEGQSQPPVEKWNPDFCGDIDMRIARDGTWYYMGTPITRQRMVKLFSTILRRDADGKTYMVTPVEKIGITVDDAPFVAVSVDSLGVGKNEALHFTTNVGESVIAGPDHPIRVEIDKTTDEPRPYIHVRGRLEALIGRAPFYEMVGHAFETEIEGKAYLAVKSMGEIFPIGPLEGTL